MKYYRLKKNTPDARRGAIFILHEETNTLWYGNEDIEYKTYNIIGGIDKWFNQVYKCKECGEFFEIIRKDGLCVPCFDKNFDPGEAIDPRKRKCEKCGKEKLNTGLNFPTEKSICVACLYPNGMPGIPNGWQDEKEEKFYRFIEKSRNVFGDISGVFAKDQIKEMEKKGIIERVWKCKKCEKWTSELTDANVCWDCIEPHRCSFDDSINTNNLKITKGYAVMIEKWLFQAPQTGMYFTAEIEKNKTYLYADGSAALKIKKLGEETIGVDEE